MCTKLALFTRLWWVILWNIGMSVPNSPVLVSSGFLIPHLDVAVCQIPDIVSCLFSREPFHSMRLHWQFNCLFKSLPQQSAVNIELCDCRLTLQYEWNLWFSVLLHGVGWMAFFLDHWTYETGTSRICWNFGTRLAKLHNSPENWIFQT